MIVDARMFSLDSALDCREVNPWSRSLPMGSGRSASFLRGLAECFDMPLMGVPFDAMAL